MATKRTSGKKRTVGTKEKISQLIREAEESLVATRDEWNRFQEKDVKKGFKEARKAILLVKKAAVEIRKTMADIKL